MQNVKIYQSAVGIGGRCESNRDGCGFKGGLGFVLAIVFSITSNVLYAKDENKAEGNNEEKFVDHESADREIGTSDGQGEATSGNDNDTASESSEETSEEKGATGNDHSETLHIKGGETINGASLLDDTGVYGRALYNRGNLVFTEKSLFSGNFSLEERGGAIYNSGGSVVFENDVEFSGKKAARGGALANDGTGTITFNKTATFLNDIAESGGGGAIYNYDKTITFNGDAKFSNNIATDGRGGAIYNNGGTIIFGGNVTFSGNSAETGGALYNSGTGTITFNLAGVNSVIKFENNRDPRIRGADKQR
ncbi:hypothetical protein FACS1894152_5940 [Bacilli bacterium]|nr:hypothetical protein FACS1894152_5940 [Bacilli bacterium]